MPLSEQEQRLLDEMERSLYHNDADDVTTVGARRGRSSYTAILIGLLGAVAGIVLLLVGVGIRQPVVGILGFAVMFAGVVFAVAPPRRLTVPADAPRSAGRKPRQSFMDSLNERWERRNDDQEQ
ncbi:MAG TPA: DUF3040 domain-containing protein [Pseudolysinimonas sp.]|nr:DUF3040 domain-containing protein [Pseudolysinimonas sp.]